MVPARVRIMCRSGSTRNEDVPARSAAYLKAVRIERSRSVATFHLDDSSIAEWLIPPRCLAFLVSLQRDHLCERPAKDWSHLQRVVGLLLHTLPDPTGRLLMIRQGSASFSRSSLGLCCESVVPVTEGRLNGFHLADEGAYVRLSSLELVDVQNAVELCLLVKG